MKRVRFLAVAAAVLLLCSSLNGAFAFDTLPQSGGYGVEVQVLQERLDELGYSVGSIDASYGGQTSAAVKSFQTDQGLPATGTVDQATWDALFDEHYVISDGTYELDVKLVPPFIYFEPDTGENTVYMIWGEEACGCILGSRFETFLVLYDDFSDLMEEWYNRDTGGSGLAIQTEDYEINGHRAALLSAKYSFTKDGKSYDRYLDVGLLELKENSTPVLVVVDFGSIESGGEPVVGADEYLDIMRSVTPVAEPAAESPIPVPSNFSNAIGKPAAEEAIEEAEEAMEEVEETIEETVETEEAESSGGFGLLKDALTNAGG